MEQNKKFNKNSYIRNFVKGCSLTWSEKFKRYIISGDMIFVSIDGIKSLQLKQDKNGNDYLQVISNKENNMGGNYQTNFFNKQFIVVRDMYGRLGFIFKNDKLVTNNGWYVFKNPDHMKFNWKGGNEYFIEDLSWDFINKIKNGNFPEFYQEEQDASKHWGK